MICYECFMAFCVQYVKSNPIRSTSKSLMFYGKQQNLAKFLQILKDFSKDSTKYHCFLLQYIIISSGFKILLKNSKTFDNFLLKLEILTGVGGSTPQNPIIDSVILYVLNFHHIAVEVLKYPMKIAFFLNCLKFFQIYNKPFLYLGQRSWDLYQEFCRIESLEPKILKIFTKRCKSLLKC